MSRFLTYISFIVFLSVLCMAAQARTGPTPDNEGKEVFPLLSICIFLSSSLQFILFQTSGNGHLYIQLIVK